MLYLPVAFALLALPADAVAASKQATLPIQAELLPSCSAGTEVEGGAIEFGTLDFGQHFALNNVITAIGQPGAGALRVTCVADLPYQVLLGPGQSGNTAARELNGPGGSTLQYNLFTDATFSQVWDDVEGVSGVGSGTAQWLPVYARVPAQAVPQAGVYSDTLTVTVVW